MFQKKNTLILGFLPKLRVSRWSAELGGGIIGSVR